MTEPATGAVVAGYEYDAYGQITQTIGSLMQPYGYTGREYDAESGLYHYRARAYDPASGVFLQVDPIDFLSGTKNLFSYVNNSPFGAGDPSGLISQSDEFDWQSNVDAAMGIEAHTKISKSLISLMAASLNKMLSMLAPSGLPAPRLEYKTSKGKTIYCHPDVLKSLTAKLKEDDPLQCKGGYARSVNVQLMRRISSKLLLRHSINEFCFGPDGDSGHDDTEGQVKQLELMIADCMGKIAKRKGTGGPSGN